MPSTNDTSAMRSGNYFHKQKGHTAFVLLTLLALFLGRAGASLTCAANQYRTGFSTQKVYDHNSYAYYYLCGDGTNAYTGYRNSAGDDYVSQQGMSSNKCALSCANIYSSTYSYMYAPHTNDGQWMWAGVDTCPNAWPNNNHGDPGCTRGDARKFNRDGTTCLYWCTSSYLTQANFIYHCYCYSQSTTTCQGTDSRTQNYVNLYADLTKATAICASKTVLSCSAGFGFTNGGTTADNSCSACSGSYYQPNSGSTSACTGWTYTSCPAGQYYTAGSASTDSTCTACGTNEYSSGGTTTQCTAKTVFSCPSGEGFTDGGLGSDNSCSTCLAGTFQANDASTATCGACPADHFSADGADACTPWKTCSKGESYAAGSATEDATCTTCPAGEFQANDASTATCSPCDTGTFSAEGADACTPWKTCDAGEFYTAGNATADATCTLCPAAEYQPDSTSTATSCLPCSTTNEYSTGGAHTCTSTLPSCDKGYRFVDGLTVAPNQCIACDPGYAQPDDSTRVAQCTPCPAGEFQDQPAADSCDDCPAGTYTSSGATTLCTNKTNCVAPEYIIGTDGGLIANDVCACSSGYNVDTDSYAWQTPEGEVRVSTPTGNYQISPSVAYFADGKYVIVWADETWQSSSRGIHAQIFNSDGTKNGGEIDVHLSSYDQRSPTVAVLTTGNFVVVWESKHTMYAHTYYQLHGKLFDSSGTDVTPNQYIVNSGNYYCNGHTYRGTGYTLESCAAFATPQDEMYYFSFRQDTGECRSGGGCYPSVYDTNWDTYRMFVKIVNLASRSNGHINVHSVTALTGGKFVVVYYANYDIFGMRYDANFNGVETLTSSQQTGIVSFQVDAVGAGSTSDPSVARLSGDAFVVVFNRDTDIWAQEFFSHGKKRGTAYKINTYTTGNQVYPRVARTGDDSFVVTWQSENQDGTGWSVYGQRFETSSSNPAQFLEWVKGPVTYYGNQDGAAQVGGTPLTQAQCATYKGTSTGLTISNLNYPLGCVKTYSGVVYYNNQGWASTHCSYETNGASCIFSFSGSIMAQKKGTEFRVNTNTGNDDKYPSVAHRGSGKFVVAWESYVVGSSTKYGVFAQLYNSDGTKDGGEFQVNTDTFGSRSGQTYNSVAALDENNYVVAWAKSSSNAEYNKEDIFAKRYYSGKDLTTLTCYQCDAGLVNVAGDFPSANALTTCDTCGIANSEANPQKSSCVCKDGHRFTTGTPSSIQEVSTGLGNQAGHITTSSECQSKAGAYDNWNSVAWTTIPYGCTCGDRASDGYRECIWNSQSNTNQCGILYSTLTWRCIIDLYEAEGCTACAAGTHRVGGDSVDGNATTCEACPAEHFSLEGSKECTAWTTCAAGLYLASPSATQDGTCTPCAAGTFQPDSDSIAQSCQACDFNTHSADGASSCTDWTECTGETHYNEVRITGEEHCDANYVCSANSTLHTAPTSTNDRVCACEAGHSFTATSGLAEIRGETLVNTETTDRQEYASVAALDAGKYVVVWQSKNQDSNGNGVYGQRYAEDGTEEGDEFRVNFYTNNNQENPSVAGLEDGKFVVVWESSGQDGSSYGVYAQRYAADGSKQGEEFLVNSHTTDSQENPSVAMHEDGSYVVVWQSTDQHYAFVSSGSPSNSIYQSLCQSAASSLGYAWGGPVYWGGVPLYCIRSGANMYYNTYDDGSNCGSGGYSCYKKGWLREIYGLRMVQRIFQHSLHSSDLLFSSSS